MSLDKVDGVLSVMFHFFLFQLNHCTFYAVQLEENKVQVIKGYTNAQGPARELPSNMETIVSNHDGVESHSSRNRQKALVSE